MTVDWRKEYADFSEIPGAGYESTVIPAVLNSPWLIEINSLGFVSQDGVVMIDEASSADFSYQQAASAHACRTFPLALDV